VYILPIIVALSIYKTKRNLMLIHIALSVFLISIISSCYHYKQTCVYSDSEIDNQHENLLCDKRVEFWKRWDYVIAHFIIIQIFLLLSKCTLSTIYMFYMACALFAMIFITNEVDYNYIHIFTLPIALLTIPFIYRTSSSSLSKLPLIILIVLCYHLLFTCENYTTSHCYWHFFSSLCCVLLLFLSKDDVYRQ
jgi:hypothetical protein